MLSVSCAVLLLCCARYSPRHVLIWIRLVNQADYFVDEVKIGKEADAAEGMRVIWGIALLFCARSVHRLLFGRGLE